MKLSISKECDPSEKERFYIKRVDDYILIIELTKGVLNVFDKLKHIALVPFLQSKEEVLDDKKTYRYTINFNGYEQELELFLKAAELTFQKGISDSVIPASKN